MPISGLPVKRIARNISKNSSLNKLNILFLGQDEFSCSILRHLHAATDLWNEIWVATNPDAKTGRRGSDLTVSALKVLANSQKLPTHTIPKKKLGMRSWEVPGPFSRTSGDLRNVIITASFGRVIPTRILDMFGPSRRFNVHPSLVPFYRGPAPIQHAIADGREQTGVSILSLEPISKGIDSGDVWGSCTVDIAPNATFRSLRATLGEVGGNLLVSTLRCVAAETVKPIPQDPTQVTLAPLIKRKFTQINWETWDASRLDRVHRAAHHQHALVTLLPYSPTLQIEQFSIRSPPLSLHPRLKGPGDSIFDPSTQSMVIRCGGKTEISATLVQQENKRVLRARDFWNGVRAEGLQDGILKLKSFPP